MSRIRIVISATLAAALALAITVFLMTDDPCNRKPPAPEVSS